MTIAQVSRKNMVFCQDTLRYYERIGLIPPVPRNKSGIRDYDEVSCGWIELMKCMRSSGVQVEALIEYVALYQQEMPPLTRERHPADRSAGSAGRTNRTDAAVPDAIKTKNQPLRTGIDERRTSL